MRSLQLRGYVLSLPRRGIGILWGKSCVNAVMSYWSAGKDTHPKLKNNLHLAFLLAQKHFGEVHFFTDKKGWDSFSFLPWASFDLSLERLDRAKSPVWNYGKIVSVGMAAERFGSFFHVDSDCFLWEKPNEEILKEPVFGVCEEIFPEEMAKERPTAFLKYGEQIDLSARWLASLSLCGGTDSQFWIEYSKIASAIIEDPDLYGFWTSYGKYPYSRGVIAEKNILASRLQKIKKPIRLIFQNTQSEHFRFCHITEKTAEAFGITVLGKSKLDDLVCGRVAERLSKNPPDLEMRKPPTVMKMMASLGKSAAVYAADGFTNATKQQHQERLEICNACEFWENESYFGLGKCRKCGCSGAKLWVASSKCPIGKW